MSYFSNHYSPYWRCLFGYISSFAVLTVRKTQRFRRVTSLSWCSHLVATSARGGYISFTRGTEPLNDLRPFAATKERDNYVGCPRSTTGRSPGSAPPASPTGGSTTHCHRRSTRRFDPGVQELDARGGPRG
jgi:hypothetical protein